MEYLLTNLTLSHMASILQVPSSSQIARDLKRILLPKGIRCPRCTRRYSFKIGSQYWCKKCRYKFTWVASTFLKGTKLPLPVVWVLLQCWVNELSPQDTELTMALSHVTIRRWFRKFQQLIPPELTGLLQGAVEVDESFIGRARFNNQTIVMGAVTRGGALSLRPIPNREQGTTDEFLLKHVDTRSKLYTDAFSSYEHVQNFFGYAHEICNHSQGHFGPTNQIEGVWMCLRRFIRKVYHHIWKEHLPQILKEFQARWNHQTAFTDGYAFLQFCTASVPSQLD